MLACTQSAILNSQNLVPNPSFEEYYECPDGIIQTNKIKDWIININSADYFNSCANSQSGVSVPQNSFGYQIPATGNAYCGLYVYAETQIGDVREYLGTRLLQPLIPNQKYYVSIKTSWANGWCATNKLGILFSNTYYGDSTTWGVLISPPPFINNFAHVYTDSIITDSVNWTTIKGVFIADSAYKYIYIGNFFSKTNIDTLWFFGGLPNCKSYYYIDDVCVSTDSLTCCSPFVIVENDIICNNIVVFPNPTSDKIIIEYSHFYNDNICDVMITDYFGKIIKFYSKYHSGNDIQLDDISSGFYILHLKFKNKTIIQKLIIN